MSAGQNRWSALLCHYNVRERRKLHYSKSPPHGYGGSEIFPKQVKLHLERDDVGNFEPTVINAEEGLRYAFLDDGTSATLDEFFELYEKHKQTLEQLHKLQIGDEASGGSFYDGPPCLQIQCKEQN